MALTQDVCGLGVWPFCVKIVKPDFRLIKVSFVEAFTSLFTATIGTFGRSTFL